MKKKEIEYGNITLGKINKMLIAFVGESTFYYYCEEFAKEGFIKNWQSKDAFQKYVNRLLAEEDSDFAGLNVANTSSIPVLVYKILDKFTSDYGCMPIIIAHIKGLVSDLYTCYKKNMYPIYETLNFYRAFFCKNYEEYAKDLIDNLLIDQRNMRFLPLYFCSASKKYSSAYNFLSGLPDFGSKEELYRKLADYSNSGKEDIEKQTEHFKQIITNQMKDALNPKWTNMKEILDFLMRNEPHSIVASWLVEAYLLSNIEKFIKKESGIPEEQIERLFSAGSHMCSIPPDLATFSNILKDLQFDRMDKDKFINSSEIIKKALNAVFNEHIYLHDENQTKEFIENVRTAVPEAAGFYCSWMEGYIQLAKDNVLGALNHYRNAFENRRFAGFHFENFIKEAVILSIYANSTDVMVREAVDPSKNRTTPLNSDAKKFWNYGYALKIFDKPAEDTFLENVWKTSSFLSTFPTSMFFENSKVKQKHPDSFIKDIGIDCFSIPEGSSFEKELKKGIENDYIRLSKLTNENINARVRMYNHAAQPAVPPLTLAIYHAASPNFDDRFISLINNWLGIEHNCAFENLNVSLVSDKGTTPLQASLRAYKTSKHQNRRDFAEYFKKISLKIIDKSSIESFTVKSVKSRREALQEAIDGYDLDLVKAIIEKGLDVNGLLISSDDVSPVYYCIQRFKQAKYPDRSQKEFLSFDSNPNIVWENLNMPGLTNSDKKAMHRKMNLSFKENEIGEKLVRASMINDMGPENFYEEQQSCLKEICLYLIEKTANQDEYIKDNSEINQKWTSLFFAAEIDDKEICRALINNGADPNRHLGFDPDWGYISFLKRCIHYEAWEVLEMFLSEFSDLARITINESDNIHQATPFVIFLTKMIDTRQHKPANYRGRDFVLNIANLFGQCGAHYNQPSAFGSANDLLQLI